MSFVLSAITLALAAASDGAGDNVEVIEDPLNNFEWRDPLPLYSLVRGVSGGFPIGTIGLHRVKDLLDRPHLELLDLLHERNWWPSEGAFLREKGTKELWFPVHRRSAPQLDMNTLEELHRRGIPVVLPIVTVESHKSVERAFERPDEKQTPGVLRVGPTYDEDAIAWALELGATFVVVEDIHKNHWYVLVNPIPNRMRHYLELRFADDPAFKSREMELKKLWDRGDLEGLAWRTVEWDLPTFKEWAHRQHLTEFEDLYVEHLVGLLKSRLWSYEDMRIIADQARPFIRTNDEEGLKNYLTDVTPASSAKSIARSLLWKKLGDQLVSLSEVLLERLRAPTDPMASSAWQTVSRIVAGAVYADVYLTGIKKNRDMGPDTAFAHNILNGGVWAVELSDDKSRLVLQLADYSRPVMRLETSNEEMTRRWERFFERHPEFQRLLEI